MDISLEEQIREFIRDSGMTQKEIACRVGVTIPLLSNFMNGKRNLSLSGTARVVAVLGLELRKKRKLIDE